jgi:hypothetical protein
LPLVLQTPHLEIFAVPHPRPIVTGPGHPRLLSLGQTGALIDVNRPGRYRVAIRYTPYWSATTGCVRRASDGMTWLTVRQAAVVRLGFKWTLHRALGVLDGASSNCRS